MIFGFSCLFDVIYQYQWGAYQHDVYCFMSNEQTSNDKNAFCYLCQFNSDTFPNSY